MKESKAFIISTAAAALTACVPQTGPFVLDKAEPLALLPLQTLSREKPGHKTLEPKEARL